MASRARGGVLAAACVCALLVVPSAEAVGSLAPTESRSWTARLVAPTAALARPGRGAVRYRFGPVARWTGGPSACWSPREPPPPDGSRWVQVMLPRRPNGSRGWIRRSRAVLQSNPWRVTVSRRRRSARLLRAGRVVRRWRVVVGAPGTPTPRGLFAVDERVRQPGSGGFVGSWVFHLTAFSDVLDNFGGGPGRIGLHGRGGASLRDPLGAARSHGCVRMDNRVIEYLARRVREGTPVEIR